MADDLKAHVVYLTYDGLTDPLGQSQVIPYLEGLAKSGYRITIISAEKKDRFSKLSHQIQIWANENNIEWVPLNYHKNPPVLSTLYDLLQVWQSFKKLHRQHNFKIVHCRSYLTSLIGLRAKKKYGVKFIFDMRGFWADERVEGGLWNLKNPLDKLIYQYFKKKEKQFLQEADHIISLTNNARQEIQSWGINPAPITVIPTCVDLDFFDPQKIKVEDQVKLRAELGIKPDDFVLLYLGSWGTWYMTEELLRFFSDLKQKKRNAKFLIVSPDAVYLNDYVYKNDVVVTQATRFQVPLHISISDATVFFIKPSFSKKASSATKLGELLTMKKIVITNRGWGDIEQLDYGNWIRFVEIHNIAFNWDERITLGPINLDQLSLKTGLESYLRVYQLLY